MPDSQRVVTLVLTDRSGAVLGALRPFEVEVPYWQEADSVVRRAAELYGLDVILLRLLDSERAAPPGGRVTYLAEAARPDAPLPALEPWPGRLTEDPLRLAYAKPGGPDAALAWAAAELTARDRRVTGPPQQIRTWNLSSLWRIPVDDGQVWLKLVPPFFDHEGAVLGLLAGEAVPTVIAHEGSRILLEHIDGEDLYDATPAQLERLLDLLVDLQVRYAPRLDTLVSTGMADFRATALSTAIGSVVDRTAQALDATDVDTLAAFVDELPDRFAAVAGCGLPDTLVHGDFHPGNSRGVGLDLILLDWGDCGVGHPLLDEPAFLDRVPPVRRPSVRDGWHRRWQAAVPGSDPGRAAALLEPVAAARQAMIYQAFLDNIEVSEHPYHRHDPRDWLQRTAAIARTGDAVTRRRPTSPR